VTKKKAAGYTRVSSVRQVSGESLDTQENAIKDFAKHNDLSLFKVYSDKGISGASIKKRFALHEMLRDAKAGKFDALIVHRLSRLGRNARELLNVHNDLKEAGVALKSIKEGIDFSSSFGRAMLTMLSAISELERDIISETTHENRVNKGLSGIPTAGALPYGRTYDKATGKWGVDVVKCRKIEKAAKAFLAGTTLDDVSRSIGMSRDRLYYIFNNSCGHRWLVKFKNQDPIEYTVPRLLPDKTIEAIRQKFEANKTIFHGELRHKYLLSHMILCGDCGKPLSGMTVKNKNGNYQYYKHKEACESFGRVPAKLVEEAVPKLLFRTIGNVNELVQSMKRANPSVEQVAEYEKEIAELEKELKSISSKKERLVDKLEDGRWNNILERRMDKHEKNEAILQGMIDELKSRLEKLVSEKEMKRRAKIISKANWQETMPFAKQRKLYQLIFAGRGPNDERLGVYVSKKGGKWSVKLRGIFGESENLDLNGEIGFG
jgi:DNA invertase Pin-like site-specific DNA recombinase/Skp family chaperone for outer membrane proteins